MQMMRAKCVQCHWVFDVASLPGEALTVCRVMSARTPCPICYADGAVMADPRPLTTDEIAAKTLGELGAASAKTEQVTA